MNKVKRKTLVHRMILMLSIALALQVFGMAPSFALQEGSRCNSSKFGNSLAMSNGKIHGGIAGANKNYSGPLYLCDGGVWVYWRMATPPKASKKQTVDVRSMQFCSKAGREVQSTTEGTLVCRYVRVGRATTLVWVRK